MRRAVFFMSICVALFSLTRLVGAGSPLEIVGINGPAAWLGLTTAGVGLLFSSSEFLRTLPIRFLFHGVALALMFVTVYAFVAPMSGRFSVPYFHVADYFLAFESSLILWLVGSDQIEDRMPVLYYVGFAFELLLASLERRVVSFATFHSSRRHA